MEKISNYFLKSSMESTELFETLLEAHGDGSYFAQHLEASLLRASTLNLDNVALRRTSTHNDFLFHFILASFLTLPNNGLMKKLNIEEVFIKWDKLKIDDNDTNRKK